MHLSFKRVRRFPWNKNDQRWIYAKAFCLTPFFWFKSFYLTYGEFIKILIYYVMVTKHIRTYQKFWICCTKKNSFGLDFFILLFRKDNKNQKRKNYFFHLNIKRNNYLQTFFLFLLQFANIFYLLVFMFCVCVKISQI